MGIYINDNGVRRIRSVFANVDGEKKTVKSIWVNKDGIPCRVWRDSIGRMVALSDEGYLFYSEDGESWVAADRITTSAVNDLVYADGKFVAVGNVAYYSEDGITWTEGVWAGNTNIVANAITYGDGLFVAVGNNRTFYSNDGVTWHVGAYISNTTFKDVVYGFHGLYVAVANDGSSYRSTDGVNWSKSADSCGANCIAYGNGVFVSVDAQYLTYSKDGDTWTDVVFEGYGGSSLCFGKDKFLLFDGNITYLSADGVSWTLGCKNLPFGADKLSYCDGLFIATNKKKSYSSTDGVTWIDMGDFGLTFDTYFNVALKPYGGG